MAKALNAAAKEAKKYNIRLKLPGQTDFIGGKEVSVKQSVAAWKRQTTNAFNKALEDEIKLTVRKIIGPIARPDKVQIVSG